MNDDKPSLYLLAVLTGSAVALLSVGLRVWGVI